VFYSSKPINNGEWILVSFTDNYLRIVMISNFGLTVYLIGGKVKFAIT